ncbi:integrase [Pollutimonas subterranea]|uniref:Integrase n=1 Tax=Pollutimonas subterranea TaxID=2045210 RepID=A0A2N4U0Q1_9BURK|nr:integrase arm-type DNA-binding domain-containing protein [Pollutimonas subterranea]PLC48591.1 integrase [Pollutimonas subterranea]
MDGYRNPPKSIAFVPFFVYLINKVHKEALRMPKLATPLTALAAKKYKPKATDYSVPDGNGLYLLVAASGKKSWQVRYKTPEGKGLRVTIGDYGDISTDGPAPMLTLQDARSRADEVHLAARTHQPIIGVRVGKQLARQNKTLEELEREQQESTARARSFAVVSEAWLKLYEPTVVNSTYSKARLIIQDYLQPRIGTVDMAILSRKDVVPIIREMGGTVPSLARTVPRYVNMLVEYCIDEEIRPEHTQLTFTSVTRKLPKSGKLPAALDEERLGALLRAIHGYENIVIRRALLLCAWTAHRPGIIATARWSEINLKRAEWAVPALEEGQFKGNGEAIRRMKLGVEHVVSLPRQALAMLQEMKAISGGAEYVFPATGKVRNPHTHRDALSRALRLMGFQGKHCTHGFRATLRTMARERLGLERDELEAQLAHTKRSANGDSYDRTTFTAQRVKIMQAWADYLDEMAFDNGH